MLKLEKQDKFLVDCIIEQTSHCIKMVRNYLMIILSHEKAREENQIY